MSFAASLSVLDPDTAAVWSRVTPAEMTVLSKIFLRAKQGGFPLTSYLDAPKPATQIESIALEDAVKECVASKAANGRRPSYVANLRNSLLRFSRGRERMPTAAITTKDIEDFVSTFDSASYRKLLLSRIGILLSWAKMRGFIRVNPVEQIEMPRVDAKQPNIITPRQAAKALVWTCHHQPKFLGWLAAAMFAGLRPQECDQLEWAKVDLTAGMATVSGASSKLRRWRIVHLEPVALEWLRVARSVGASLPVTLDTRTSYQRKLFKFLNYRLKIKDVLRHSAASYLFALKSDAAYVAAELGNSPEILFRHYRRLVTKEAAARYFNLLPNPTRHRYGKPTQ
ncbi:MAG: tyrosine-type recombinase/integrase [Limisphaerales bacterium]